MKKIKVSIQGFKGSYSHQVIREIFSNLDLDFELVENSTFADAFSSINKTGFGIIPMENSTAGFVHKAFYELAKYDFEIIGEYFFDINHALLGVKGSSLNKIEKVFSHYQALAQTSKFMKENSLESVDYGDTGGGAKYISEENNLKFAALGSEILSEIYNLDILKKDINDEEENSTRFFLIKKKDYFLDVDFDVIDGIKKQNSLIFKTKSDPGSLYKVLGCFAEKNINLTKIISQPIKDKKFIYSFYIEFESEKDNVDIKYALKKAEYFTEEII